VGEPWLVRGTFQSLDAAVELSVRELDHRLRIGEASPHLGADISRFTVEFLVDQDDLLGDQPDFVSGPFRYDVHVAAHLFREPCRGLLELAAHLRRLLVEMMACLCRLFVEMTAHLCRLLVEMTAHLRRRLVEMTFALGYAGINDALEIILVHE
jgi:hypothetical protein